VHIGLDFGLTPAALVAQRTPAGQWRIRHEICTESTGVIRFAGILKRFIDAQMPGVPILSITGDPAGDQRQSGDNEERTVFQLLEANKISAIPAFTNDFAIRTEAFAAPMRRMIDGKPGFMLHPDCKVTRKGLAGAYHFRRMQVPGDERYRDVPEKNAYSHPCFVAGTMIAAGDTSVPIEELRIGDVVNTPIGPRSVVANMARDVDALVDVEISSGSTLRCTPDHPFARPDGGFVRADALQYMDELVIEGCPWVGLQSISSKSSMESATTSGQTATTGRITLRAARTCIELFGKNTARSSSTNMRRRGSVARVVRVVPAGRGTVYNLEVADAHCYYAGGVLVSNCEAGQYALMGAGEGHAIVATHSANTAKDAEAFRRRRGLS
jgi:hypothetical protein